MLVISVRLMAVLCDLQCDLCLCTNLQSCCRIPSAGIAALLYSAEVQQNTKVTHAVQFDVTNPNTPPKYGFALDLKA